MDCLETIYNRKSVRHFQNKPVSKQEIDLLLKAGMAAPSAANRQPWAFFVITQRNTLDNLGALLPYARMITRAPMAIVVCGDLSKSFFYYWEDEFWIQDCSAATQNILLAAEALGLGAVWSAVYPERNWMQSVRNSLFLPYHIIPLNIIPIGYPTGKDKHINKWKTENIHWEKW